jgi:cytochrome P450
VKDTETEAKTPDQLLLDLMLTPERSNPHDLYRQLREQAPVHHSELAPVWILTRYQDCRTLLRDNQFGKVEGVDLDEDVEENPLFAANSRRRRDDPDPVASRSLIAINPPDHTRLRGLVSRAFTPRRIAELEPAVIAMTDEILDEIADATETEVLDVLGFRLPVRVIGELVGVPAVDRDQFRPLVRAAASALEPGTTDDQLAAAGVAAKELQDYFAELLTERQARPQDDLTSALIGARDDDDQLTEEEMIATLVLIFAAGFETTTNLIGNGLVTLLTHPDELIRLRANPELLPAAVEEMLRYESPVQVDARTALEPATIGDLEVAKGEWVITFLGAANRDPTVFDDPESFSIVERDSPPLSFASGIHYCLGASLARLEGEAVFGRLLNRFADMELVDDAPRWRNSIVLRGLEELNVRFA